MSTSKKQLNDLNNLIMPNVVKVQRLSTAPLEKELAKHDISLAEFRIVGLLMGENQGYNQKQLAQQLGISPPSLSVLIQRLENKHIVERVPDPLDQRVKRIKISPQVNFKEIEKLIIQLDKKATRGINKQDLDITWQVLQQIIKNMTD